MLCLQIVKYIINGDPLTVLVFQINKDTCDIL